MAGISSPKGTITDGPDAASQLFLYASGYYYCGTSQQGSDATIAGTQNVAYAVMFVVSKTTTFDRIQCEVTSAIASSTVRLGIYNSTNNIPTTKLLDAGTVDSSSTGAKEITISQTLTPGVYFLVSANQGGASSPTLRARTQYYSPILTPQSTTGNTNYNAYSATSVSGEFPTSPTWGLINAANSPKIMMRAV